MLRCKSRARSFFIHALVRALAFSLFFSILLSIFLYFRDQCVCVTMIEEAVACVYEKLPGLAEEAVNEPPLGLFKRPCNRGLVRIEWLAQCFWLDVRETVIVRTMSSVNGCSNCACDSYAHWLGRLTDYPAQSISCPAFWKLPLLGCLYLTAVQSILSHWLLYELRAPQSVNWEFTWKWQFCHHLPSCRSKPVWLTFEESDGHCFTCSYNEQSLELHRLSQKYH